jgi:NADH dehydrogenase/NADH:ubiquinone oxidoreductase subunit G
VFKIKLTVLETCIFVGENIPRFCYHELLSVSGNCRMCLVEVDENEKPVVSCVTTIKDDMVVYTNTSFIKKSRETILESILLNHPLDCPICDQAGECDLQEQTKYFGSKSSKFFYSRREVEDKNCGILIKTIMTRCIHCTRCVRFGEEVVGTRMLGTFNRGSLTEIGNYIPTIFESEISGTVIDLCPVGALTSNPYSFELRS